VASNVAKLMFEIVQEADRDNLKITPYSGRFMFGKECLGLQCSNLGEALHIIFLMAQEAINNEDLLNEIENMIIDTKQDSMGHDMIVYWPNASHNRNDQDKLENDAEEEINDSTGTFESEDIKG
jgi:hypothetical protein